MNTDGYGGSSEYSIGFRGVDAEIENWLDLEFKKKLTLP
jgi:hypothetical protein